MAGGESVLDAIYEEDELENADDVEMVDVEEGELLEHCSEPEAGQGVDGDVEVGNQGSGSKNRRRRANKKKNKRRKIGSAPQFTDINRFVLDTCRRLKEKKSYMVYTAVGCLGFSALSDLVNEVDAIQACGGQMTADGRRVRTGGGILWNIIKSREPAAYREIMKKAKEFEKQFRQPTVMRAPGKDKDESSKGSACTDNSGVQTSDHGAASNIKLKESRTEEKRKSVHERIRKPVTYDDLVCEEPLNASTADIQHVD